jgi:hypothetical protein
VLHLQSQLGKEEMASYAQQGYFAFDMGEAGCVLVQGSAIDQLFGGWATEGAGGEGSAAQLLSICVCDGQRCSSRLYAASGRPRHPSPLRAEPAVPVLQPQSSPGMSPWGSEAATAAGDRDAYVRRVSELEERYAKEAMPAMAAIQESKAAVAAAGGRWPDAILLPGPRALDAAAREELMAHMRVRGARRHGRGVMGTRGLLAMPLG